MDNKIVIIGIAVIVAALIILAIYIKQKYKRPTDYRALFVIGCTFIALGVTQGNHAFTICGILMMIFSLRKKEKWNENRFRWSNLSKEEKRIKISVLSIILISAIAGGLMYFIP